MVVCFLDSFVLVELSSWSTLSRCCLCYSLCGEKGKEQDSRDLGFVFILEPR